MDRLQSCRLQASTSDIDFTTMKRAGGIAEGLPGKDVLSAPMMELMCGMLALDPADRISMHKVAAFLKDSVPWLEFDEADEAEAPPSPTPVPGRGGDHGDHGGDADASTLQQWLTGQSSIHSSGGASEFSGDGWGFEESLTASAWSDFRKTEGEHLKKGKGQGKGKGKGQGGAESRSTSLSGLGSMQSLVDLDLTSSATTASLTPSLQAMLFLCNARSDVGEGGLSNGGARAVRGVPVGAAAGSTGHTGGELDDAWACRVGGTCGSYSSAADPGAHHARSRSGPPQRRAST